MTSITIKAKKLIINIEKIPYKAPHFLEKKHIPSLDGWRTIAIFFVIISHIKSNTKGINNTLFNFLEFLPIGHLGVKIFFIISGFLITSLLIKEKIKTGKIDIKSFFIRRFFRIFPLLWFYLITVAVLNKLFNFNLYFEHFVGPLLYLSNFNIFSGTWLLGHTWSLSVEEQFYLIWPFIFKKSLHPIIWILCFLVFAILLRPLAYKFGSLTNYTFAPFITEASSIFTGALLAILAFKGYFNILKSSYFKSYILILNVIVLYFVILLEQNALFGKFTLILGWPIINIIIAYFILFSIYFTNTNLFKILNYKYIIQIGIMSYSIYIWQQLFLIPIEISLQWHAYFPLPLNLIITFIVAYLSYNFFEKPFLKLKQKFSIH